MSEAVDFTTSATARQPAPMTGGGFKDVSKGGRVASQAEIDAIKETRQQHFEELRTKAMEQAPIAAPSEAAVIREDIESFELTLPNGLQVLYGPPRNVSMNLRIAALLGDNSTNQIMVAIATTIFSVRAINGRDMPPINTMIDLTKFANMIGDDGMDILTNLHRDCWPPLTKSDLPAIKKNLRPI